MKITNKKNKILVIALCLMTLSTGLFAQKRITLKVASSAPSRSPWDIQMKKLSQQWAKITKGQVRIKFYPMSSMGGESAAIQRMRPPRPGRRPSIDGAVLSPVGLNTLAPQAKLFTLAAPFLIQNRHELDIVLKKYGHLFEKKIEESGCKILTWSNAGWLTFYTKKPYSNLRELKNLKIACSNDSQDFVDILKICGFNTYAIPPSKFNQAIKSSRGAEGFSGVHIMTFAMGLYKDISYILEAQVSPMMSGFVISEESWKLVPEKYKAELLKSLEEMNKRISDDLEKMEADYLRDMKRAGVKVLPLSEAEKEKWTKEFYNDMQRVNKQKPNILNIDAYEKISKLLETYRK